MKDARRDQRPRAGLNDGEAIIGWRHARRLHVASQHVIDEGRFTGGVVAQQQQHGFRNALE